MITTKMDLLHRTYIIEIFQMIELIYSQIQASQQIDHQQSLLNNKRAAMINKYQANYVKYIEDQQNRVNQQILAEEQVDRTQQEKMVLQQSLRELQHKLKTAELQKLGLLSKCQRYENKMEWLRPQQQKHKCHSRQLLDQRSALKKQISQNQAHNLKIGAQNEQLRERCELQLSQVGDRQISNNNDHLYQKVKCSLQRNIKQTQLLQDIENARLQFYNQNKAKSNMQNRQRIIELELQLKQQIYAKQMIKQQIQAERYVEIVFTMKQQVLHKIQHIKHTIITQDQQKQLQNEHTEMIIHNKQLRQKLAKYIALNNDMLQLYQNLSTKLTTLKNQDSKSLNKMSLSSTRFSKTLDYRRHFLKERQTIVDRYTKYLQ